MLSKIKAALILAVSTGLAGTAAPPTTYTIPLTGEAQTNFAHPLGGTGDPDGRGLVRLAVDPGRKQVCYDFTLSGLATPLMANIHEGASLKNGPPVVTLFTGPGAELEGCVHWLRNQLNAIVSDPQDFYVEIGTTEYPDGALRGQLAS